MVQIWVTAVCAIAAALLGGLLVFFWQRSKSAVLLERLASTQAQADAAADLRSENEQHKVRLAELNRDREADKEKLVWLEHAEQQLREAFQALAAQSLQTNADELLNRSKEQFEATLALVRGDWDHQKTQFQALVDPLTQSLQALDSQVEELEQRRVGAYEGVQEQLRNLSTSHSELQKTTTTLAQALKSSSVRGRWGELQLRRVVELAGMVKHVDFEEQSVTDDGRPDMVVQLPNGGCIPVDAKSPMTSYLEAIEATDERTRNARLADHVKSLSSRMRDLSGKAYWKQFDRAPEFVVMFVPNEASLSSACELDPRLLEMAMEQRVLLCTPITLLALLRSAAFGWQQYQVSESIRSIADQSRDLYDRLTIFAGHLARIGEGLGRSVEAYNDAVGSLERRILPAARRFREIGLGSTDLQSAKLIDSQVRQIRTSSLGDESQRDAAAEML